MELEKKEVNSYERAHIRDIAISNRKIGLVIDDAMKEIARRFTTVKGKRFAGVMNERLAELHDQILNNGKKEIRNQWMLANEMNNKNIDGYLASVKVSDTMQKSFRAPNLSALNAFIDRTEKKMNLSGRVWNLTNGAKGEIENLLATGILEGKSARTTAKEMMKYLKGKPIEYKGTLLKGKNIEYQTIRIVATEMNMAFRTSDYLQNNRLPFMTGITINLSPSHPEQDICDEMAGEYPKGFEFIGWHPFCICYATYETIDKEDFINYIKTGEINQRQFTTAIPKRAQMYLDKNGARLLGYENKPYWLENNFTDKLELRDVMQIPIMAEPVQMVPEVAQWIPAKTIQRRSRHPV